MEKRGERREEKARGRGMGEGGRKDKANKLGQEGTGIYKSGQKEGHSVCNDREVGARKVTQETSHLQKPGELLWSGTSHFPV